MRKREGKSGGLRRRVLGIIICLHLHHFRTELSISGVIKSLWAIGEAPVTPKTTPTALPTPEIESATPPPSPSNSPYSKFSLPVIVILAISFLVGGVYVIYRKKKKPAGYQPPEHKEKKAIDPHLQPIVSTTKPELTLSLDRDQLTADDWDRMTIRLVNRGNGHARDVLLTFSNEFETKWIKPVYDQCRRNNFTGHRNPTESKREDPARNYGTVSR